MVKHAQTLVVTPPSGRYAGEWTFRQAAHLLRRSSYGPTESLIHKAVEAGLDQAVDNLLGDLPAPEPPINPNNKNDIYVPVGKSWIGLPQPNGTAGYRRRSLYAWTILQGMQTPYHVREKMFLFWHNHFATENINDPRYLYQHSLTLRSNALGNFRELTKKITVDPLMLRYLNGNQNTKHKPNENYARELLELFTIGKGPLAGPGDYTNYTEDDILAIAKVLTGWKEGGANKSQHNYLPVSWYKNNLHDNSVKTLSHRFDQVEISNQRDQEYKHLIDIIFQKREVARFITLKLYRWFINYDISEEVEQQFIEPMASLLYDHDYEIRPLLGAFFRSEEFYREDHIGAMIKSPLDQAIGMINCFEKKPAANNLKQAYDMGIMIYNQAAEMQQRFFFPPDVAGWKAYYQGPGFYQTWINSSTLRARKRFCDLTLHGNYFNGQKIVRRNILKVDVLSFATSVSEGRNPIKLIEAFAARLFPNEITNSQKEALKEVLIPGLPDYEWSVEFGDYLAKPGNQALKNSLQRKLQQLIEAMLAMPEAYLT